MATASTATGEGLSDKELADGGMKTLVTWVRDENYSKVRRSAANRKKAERERKKKEKNEKHVYVETIDDGKAITTLKAVAKAIKDPVSLAVISAVVNDDPWLRWLINAVSIKRFREIGGISSEDAETLWRSARTAIEIAINHDCVIDLIHEVAPGTDRIRIDLARLVVTADPALRAAITAVANDPWLVERTIEVAKSSGRNKVLEQAMTSAIREPQLVVRMTSALQAGGFRGWMLKHILKR